MGLYINPQDISKEDWLGLVGELQTSPPKQHRIGTKLVVCLVDNGPFSAAAVAYDQLELEDFDDPIDTRPKAWYLVEEADIRVVCGKGAKTYLDSKRS